MDSSVKMGFKILFLLSVVQVVVVYCQSPGCQLSDSKCLKSKAQEVYPQFVAGMPEIGVKALDPMFIDKIKVDLSGLKLDISNAEISGLKNGVVDKISVDPAKKKMKLVFHSDFSLKGKYRASGQLLILPINGDGETNMKLKNCQIQMDMTYDIIKDKNGQDRIELKSYKYTYDVKDSAVYKLTNLFNGNKALSDTMHTFMNQNWKLLSAEFGVPIFNQPIERIYNNIKTYLSSQPVG